MAEVNYKSSTFKRIQERELAKQQQIQQQIPTQEKGIVEKGVGLLPKSVLKALSSDSVLLKNPLAGGIAGKVFPKGFGKETERLRKRFLDSVSFGITAEADKALGKDVSYREGRSFKDDTQGASLDTAATLAGYLIPGLGWLKGAKALGAGAKAIPKLGQGASKTEQLKRLTKVAKEQAKEGIAVGTGLAASEVAVREAINPDDYSAEQNFGYIASSALSGAILDPLAYGAISLLTKGKVKIPKEVEKETTTSPLGLPEPKQLLLAPPKTPLLGLPAPSKITPDIIEQLYNIRVNPEQFDAIKKSLSEKELAKRIKEKEKSFIKTKEMTPSEIRRMRLNLYEEVFADILARQGYEDIFMAVPEYIPPVAAEVTPPTTPIISTSMEPEVIPPSANITTPVQRLEIPSEVTSTTPVTQPVVSKRGKALENFTVYIGGKLTRAQGKKIKLPTGRDGYSFVDSQGRTVLVDSESSTIMSYGNNEKDAISKLKTAMGTTEISKPSVEKNLQPQQSDIPTTISELTDKVSGKKSTPLLTYEYIGKSGNKVQTNGKEFKFDDGSKGFYFEKDKSIYLVDKDGIVLSKGKDLKEAVSLFKSGKKVPDETSKYNTSNRMPENQEKLMFEKLRKLYNEEKKFKETLDFKDETTRLSFYKKLKELKQDIPDYIKKQFEKTIQSEEYQSKLASGRLASQVTTSSISDLNKTASPLTQKILPDANLQKPLTASDLQFVKPQSKESKYDINFLKNNGFPTEIKNRKFYVLRISESEFRIIDAENQIEFAKSDSLKNLKALTERKINEEMTLAKKQNQLDLKKIKEQNEAEQISPEVKKLKKELEDLKNQVPLAENNLKNLSKMLKSEFNEDGMLNLENVEFNDKIIKDFENKQSNILNLIYGKDEKLRELKKLLPNETLYSQSDRKIFSNLQKYYDSMVNTVADIRKKREQFRNSSFPTTKSLADSVDSNEIKIKKQIEQEALINQRVEDFDINLNKDSLSNGKFRVIDDATNEEKIIKGIIKDFNGRKIVLSENNKMYQIYDFQTGGLIGEDIKSFQDALNIMKDTIKYAGQDLFKNSYLNRARIFLENQKKELLKEGQDLTKEINKEITGKLYSNPMLMSPKQMFLMAKFGNHLLKSGFTEVGLWSLKMTEQFGDLIRPLLKTIYKNSKMLYSNVITEKELKSNLEKDFSKKEEIVKLTESKLPKSQTTQGSIPKVSEVEKKVGRAESEVPSEPIGGSNSTKASKFTVDFIDRLSPLKQLGGTIYEKVADAVRGGNLANKTIYSKQVDLEGNVLGKSLKDIVESVNDELPLFSKYLVYRASLARLAKNDAVSYMGKKLNTDDVLSELKLIEESNPKIALAALEWDGFFKNVRELYKKYNVFTAENIAKLEEMYPMYSPLLRDFDEKTSFAILQKIVKGGSDKNVFDPIISAMEQQGRTYTFLLKNRANQELLARIEANPQRFKDLGITVGETTDVGKRVELIQNVDDYEKNNTLKVIRNGKVTKINFQNSDVFDALTNYSGIEKNAIIDTFEEFTKAVKRSATGALSPLWSVKGIVMDTSRAIIQSENPIAHLGLLLKASVSSFAKPGSALREMIDNYEFSGNGMSSALRDTKESRISTLDFEKGLKAKGKRAVRVINPLSDKSFFAQMNDFLENVNRVAAFDYKLKQLGGQKTPENIRIASDYARKITTDYTVKGKKSMELEKFFPYTTAAIAGTNQMLKNIKKNPLKTAGVLGATLVLPKLIEYAKFQDDEDYQRLNKRELYRNLIIGKREDGTFVKVPLDPQFGSLAQLVLNSVDAFKTGNPDSFKKAMTELTDIYSPPPVTGILRGISNKGEQYFNVKESLKGVARASSLSSIASVMTNESFTGAPIESLEFQLSPIRDSLKYTEKTSGVAKVLGKLTDFSPMKIDYLLRSFGGDFARYGLPLTAEANSIKADDYLRNFLVDPTLSNNLAENFYNSRENLKRARAEYLQKNKPLPTWYNEKAYQAITSQSNNSVSKRLSQLREAKKKVSLDKTLTNSTRQMKLKELQELINKTYIDWNNALYRAGIPNTK